MFLEYPLAPRLFKFIKKKGNTLESYVSAVAQTDRNGWAE